MNSRFSPCRRPLVALLAVVGLSSASRMGAQAPAATNPGELSVERIFAVPSLSGKLDAGLAWAPDGKRLSYVETGGSGKSAKQELMVLDTAAGQRSVLLTGEQWETALTGPAAKDTQATGLGRHAPPLYQWAPSGDAILLQGPTSLAWFDLKSHASQVLVSGMEELADPKISPDGKHVSFVRGHNLWVVPTAGGKVRALTEGGTEEVHKGELDWVYPEELDITTAYWWSPDSSSVAFLEMDERKVTQFSLLNFASYTGEAESERYPVPGGANPVVHVYVVPVSGGAPRLMDTGSETDIYLPRVDWLPDAKHLSIQRLNREQNLLDLLLAEAASGKAVAILTEKDPHWINLSHDLRFLKDSKRFLWSSERSGYRHLYLYDVSGKQLAQLTKGDWEVRRVEAVDEAKSEVYFTATEKSPIERQLYRVSFDGSHFSRLSQKDGTHDPLFTPDAASYVDTYSNVMTPPRRDIYSVNGTKMAAFEENQVPELAQYRLSPVEFFTMQTRDGVTLHCSMIKPPQFDPSKKYPVITFTYGGPHAQVVTNAWGRPATFLWHQMMAQKGYIIFSLDNRGSTARGHAFEEPIYHHLGAQELADQREGADWLRRQSYVDANRMGIWGWSYGGHMTLHAMFEAGDIYKAGFAGGPVTDWHFYDTIYTERYMGLLPKEEQNFQASSPIKNAGKLTGKLLIAHGTGDDNVHYSNTLSLVNDLIRDGKYVEVMAFPGRGHGVSDAPAQRILWERVTKFFLDNL
ncbi:MAG TPA: S9 family peptidase [Candidatus Acidoferrum sp.]|nr:S9 family peptidase [Candidatus Acidoferrum sp.]